MPVGPRSVSPYSLFPGQDDRIGEHRTVAVNAALQVAEHELPARCVVREVADRLHNPAPGQLLAVGPPGVQVELLPIKILEEGLYERLSSGPTIVPVGIVFKSPDLWPVHPDDRADDVLVVKLSHQLDGLVLGLDVQVKELGLKVKVPRRSNSSDEKNSRPGLHGGTLLSGELWGRVSTRCNRTGRGGHLELCGTHMWPETESPTRKSQVPGGVHVSRRRFLGGPIYVYCDFHSR